MDLGTFVSIGGISVLMAVIFVAMYVEDWLKKRKNDRLPESAPVAPTSVSLLAGLSFFSGLGAIFLASVTGVLMLTMSMEDLFPVSENTHKQIDLAARIVLYVSLLPAVGAVAFALAARGVIAESRNAVRGRPLYRTGLLLAVITAVIVFDAKILNPATWARASELAGEASPAEQGYLGVETGPLDQSGGNPLIRIVPGSPADRAGLKVGDLVMTINGTPVHKLPPQGNPSAQGWSPGTTTAYIGGYIRSLKPGSQVTLGVRRGKETLGIVAELAASFGSLLELLQAQSLDDERLAVLRAAGGDRRYSADELRRICGAFDLDHNRLVAIESALPKLQDPQNAYQILGSLELAHSKKKVSEWIEAAKKK